MDKAMRDAEWDAVEHGLAAMHVPLGTAMSVGLLIEGRNDDVLASVKAELRRAGIEVIKVAQKKRWPFGTRWQVSGRAPKLPMSRPDIDAWLDRVEASIAPYGATVLNWTPLDPAPNVPPD